MLESIIHYATSDSECRSRMLVAYFGETKSEDCGICDVCLSRKRNAISQKQAKEIELKILEILADNPFTISEIVRKINRFKENDVLAILRWLIEEGRIQADGESVKLP
jgi:ATP-dependent DNA helicase RecQ